MRLRLAQIVQSRHCAAESFGLEVRVWFFGPRVDNSNWSCNIDMFVQTRVLTSGDALLCKIRMFDLLESRLNEMQVRTISRQ